MKKEDLMKIDGMTDSIADAVISSYQETIKNFIPKSRFDEVNEAKKNAESLVKERDKQLEDLKKASGDNEDLKKQIETLQAENKTAKENYEATIKRMQIDNAVETAIKSAGGKNTTAIKALLKDLDKAELSDDGTVKGLSDQISELAKSESYLFEVSNGGSGKPSGASPAGGSSNPSGNGKPLSEMTYEDFCKQMN